MPKLATAGHAMLNGKRVLIVTASLLAMACLTSAQAEDFKLPFLSHAYFEQQEKERLALKQAFEQEVRQHELKLLRAKYSAATLRYRQLCQRIREDAERKQFHQTLLALPNGEVVVKCPQYLARRYESSDWVKGIAVACWSEGVA